MWPLQTSENLQLQVDTFTSNKYIPTLPFKIHFFLQVSSLTSNSQSLKLINHNIDGILSVYIHFSPTILSLFILWNPQSMSSLSISGAHLALIISKSMREVAMVETSVWIWGWEFNLTSVVPKASWKSPTLHPAKQSSFSSLCKEFF